MGNGNGVNVDDVSLIVEKIVKQLGEPLKQKRKEEKKKSGNPKWANGRISIHWGWQGVIPHIDVFCYQNEYPKPIWDYDDMGITDGEMEAESFID